MTMLGISYTSVSRSVEKKVKKIIKFKKANGENNIYFNYSQQKNCNT
jgi:hypothetical protein